VCSGNNMFLTSAAPFLMTFSITNVSQSENTALNDRNYFSFTSYTWTV